MRLLVILNKRGGEIEEVRWFIKIIEANSQKYWCWWVKVLMLMGESMDVISQKHWYWRVKVFEKLDENIEKWLNTDLLYTILTL